MVTFAVPVSVDVTLIDGVVGDPGIPDTVVVLADE
jgi:hypothetical protein